MGFLGELGAGGGFLVVGAWQAYVSVKAYRLHGTSPSSRPSAVFQGFGRYAEHAVVALLAVLHMVFSLISAETGDRNNGSGVGAAFALERFGVAAMFLLYAVVALISEGTTALPLPAGTVDFIAVVAFFEQFTLFYLTTGEEDVPGLETQYYSLLLVPIGVCLLSTIMDIAYPAAVLPRLARSLALMLQGTWFFQMAASLFSKKFIAQGCELVKESEGVDTVRCEGMSLMRGRALATLQFNCHLALLLLVLLPIYCVLCKIYSVPATYERLDDNQITAETRDLDNGQETGVELAQADYFHVLEDDDEEEGELQSKEVADTNGFHRVVI